MASQKEASLLLISLHRRRSKIASKSQKKKQDVIFVQSEVI